MTIFNNKLFIIFMILLETALFLIMAFITGRKYENSTKIKKILWRIILLIPLGIIIVPNALYKIQEYKILLFAGFCTLFAADMVIIFIEFGGLIVFLAYHIINIINYSRIFLFIDKKTPWILLVLIIVLWFVILKLSFKKSEYEKFFVKNKVPDFLMHPIYAQSLIFIYILSVLISGWCGCRLFYVKEINMFFPLFASIGALIFVIGDYFIFYEMLKRPERPFHQILNNTLYYIPLIMYAMLSVVGINK